MKFLGLMARALVACMCFFVAASNLGAAGERIRNIRLSSWHHHPRARSG
jgi:hypothetical protein